jgi:predicted Rdx family selenoprotein
VAARLVADIIEEFEFDLTALTLRPYDDGRFILRVNGDTVYDKERTGKFPKYSDDIREKLGSLV